MYNAQSFRVRNVDEIKRLFMKANLCHIFPMATTPSGLTEVSFYREVPEPFVQPPPEQGVPLLRSPPRFVINGVCFDKLKQTISLLILYPISWIFLSKRNVLS